MEKGAKIAEFIQSDCFQGVVEGNEALGNELFFIRSTDGLFKWRCRLFPLQGRLSEAL
jgi:hypothetical protein